jgi:hypothetical protein
MKSFMEGAALFHMFISPILPGTVVTLYVFRKSKD